jgi:CRISPR-associated endoribonuclease Cas6
MIFLPTGSISDVRLLVHLRARRDAAYATDYHRSLAGRLWQALDDPRFDALHDASEPNGFCFGNPFPFGRLEEGDRRSLLIAAVDDVVLDTVASSLRAEPTFEVEGMAFTVEDITTLSPDVGEPGTRGVLECATGLVVRIPPSRFDEHGIDAPGDAPEFWTPEHSLGSLKRHLERNLERKHDRFCADYLPGPDAVDGDLFDEYELLKTYALPVRVTEGVEETYVLSKFRFGYRVRDEDHRRHLNLALDAGLGERNSLGFGFVNVRENEVVTPADAARS